MDAGFQELPIRWVHSVRSGELPLTYRDPFDRLLVAQAMVERVPILTADPLMGKYAVETVW